MPNEPKSLEDILRTYYFVKWENDDECVKEIATAIRSYLLARLPKEKEIVRHRDHDKLIREYEGYNKALADVKERIL